MKHTLVVRLILAFQRKEKGFVFLDTHAGRGGYDLTRAATGDRLRREPEWPAGIGRLWTASGLPPEVAAYVDLVRRHDRAQGNLTDRPRFYPGSPLLAAALARPQDRLALWEKHPAECDALRSEFRVERRATVMEGDGYGALAAVLPPPERRALILIDPPFEELDERTRITRSLQQGMRRFPRGTYALWYPLTERTRDATLLIDAIASLSAPALTATLRLGTHSTTRVSGCGLAVVNPPWRFDGEARTALETIGRLLNPGAGGASEVRWIVPEGPAPRS